MDSLDKFLDFYTGKITADQSVPVDLSAICVAVGAAVEEREMIPEAVMHANGRGFLIYLQSNFANFPGAALRRRFSLAHELGHTLFYEERDGELKHRRDAPRGDGLEAACHKAASMILVPGKVLKAELRQNPPVDCRAIADLANRFEVSIEVMLRRMHEMGSFERGWAPILTRRTGDVFAIEYAAYPLWLKPCLAAPKRGMAFQTWFQGVEQPDGRLTRDTHVGILDAVPVVLTGSSTMFELRMRS